MAREDIGMAHVSNNMQNSGEEIKRSRSQRARQIAPINEQDIQPQSSIPVPEVGAPPHSSIEVQSKQTDDTDSGFYRNSIGLFLFLVHLVAAFVGMGYFGFKGIQGALKSEDNGKYHIEHWYPQLAAACGVAIIFSLIWQKLVIEIPDAMIKWALWTSPMLTFLASLMLISTSYSSSVGLGVFMLLFSICQALYSSWVTPRVKYTRALLTRALRPTTMFPTLARQSYWIILIALLWTLVWLLGVLGVLNHEYAAFIILAFVISLAWIMVVFRNIVNVTISRVVALFYTRGMSCDPHFSLQRAMTTSLGSISLGSSLVPALELLRVLARAMNLLEVEDEFMFSCAHCYFIVMETIFKFGNNWGFVQVGAYHKGFVRASRDIWHLIQERQLEPVINLDLTSSISFLSGIAGGSLCVLVSGSWTFATHKSLTATVSFLSFLMGYFMTRIAMAVPQACVSSYYVCFAENPQNRAFDNTIPDRIRQLEAVLSEV